MPPISSPCVKICVIDETSGLCRGCLRTLDEIARWGALTESERQTVMRSLPDRRGRLSGEN
ncbi:putative Fe-S protein [Hartmannibacter diazotrophicus]|uniref:Putative Fe-S protein n=1 Tax=Hartmannibacter diazotrophicus TaxID=1482074 RepID=A0A2C9D8X4_9HYPH|nr:DUF1289 domain-containing protein [Hartmannibacter diazotrophicus]SON56035.1 putative Fe-S protein [Hartmannibacter diazotrophicus]